jgi:hypothetical protein
MEGPSIHAGKKQRSLGAPSLDEFHGYLQALFSSTSDDVDIPHVQFTEGAVVGLRQAYWTYLQQVASNLVEHDSLDDLDVVVQALNLDESTADIVAQAQELLAVSSKSSAAVATTKGSASTFAYAKKKHKRQKISADMEAEQERLLQQSKASVVRSQQGRSQQEQSKPSSSQQE